MNENTCVCCGRIIPEGRQICLRCGDYDDMQTFRRAAPEKPAKRYFRIRDDCGWTHYVKTDRTDLTAESIELLTPHVRAATEISEAEFKEAKK